MASKTMRVSFPPKDLEVYELVKGKAAPSKYIITAIRFYEENHRQHRETSDQKSLEQFKQTILQECESKMRDMLDKALKEYVPVQQVAQAAEYVSAEVALPSDVLSMALQFDLD